MALSNRMPLLVASLAALMVAPVALAQHHDMLGMMDADGNGAVSAAEHAAAAQAMFDKADANHDGSLDAGEMAGAHKGMAKHTMADGDKKMACSCCGGGEGEGKMAGCGMADKHDPVGDAMSGHAAHEGHGSPAATP